jgi:hypothetical protein
LGELFSVFGLSGLTKQSNGVTRLFTAENVYGRKGAGGMAKLTEAPQPEVAEIGQKWDGKASAARELGAKWKVRPCITLEKESVTTILDTQGPGVVTHMWITMDPASYRDLILRIYWDDETIPSVEAPIGDFFCCGWAKPLNILSIPMNVNPKGGMNCYFPMPFRKRARITAENRRNEEFPGFFYAISVDERAVESDELYFHAGFRRENPLPYGSDYTIIDGIKGAGHYVGTQLCWQQNNSGWWGEGELKAFIDGDTEFPSYCGTGTEDYFGGAWCFYSNYSAPFLGYQDVSTMGENARPTNQLGNRHSMYRFHVMDPIRFKQDLKVTIQALGWRSGGRFLPLQDDLASVAYWYQTEPHAEFKPLGDRNQLEIV